ncbi:hypothetical protein M569_10494, partial [Genlisea aurea]
RPTGKFPSYINFSHIGVPKKRKSPAPMETVKRKAVKNLVSNLASVSEQTRTAALCEIRILSKDDPESRELIVEAHAVPLIAEALYSPAAIVQENAAATLLNLSISTKENLTFISHGVLDALSHALRNPSSPSAAQCAAAAIFSLLRSESLRPIIGDKRDIIFGLVEIVRSPRSAARSIKDSLRALFGIALCPMNRAQMIELGAPEALLTLAANESRPGLIEDATAVLAQMAGCDESWEGFKRGSGAEILMDLLDGCGGRRMKENCVSGLLSLVQFGGDEAAEYLKRRKKLDGIVDIAENGTDKGKSKAMELLKLLHHQ